MAHTFVSAEEASNSGAPKRVDVQNLHLNSVLINLFTWELCGAKQWNDGQERSIQRLRQGDQPNGASNA